ncbi:uncharacterized protein LOC8030437 [Ixodes scapularis]|uniref:uncharacterized protein LOC8030437 n=1 Tax=Ixodes scapularis TaxID=6945 RepID=UPI001C389DCB|nr:uncharacterized protein LOC8030437 [Ixodes scapularis]
MLARRLCPAAASLLAAVAVSAAVWTLVGSEPLPGASTDQGTESAPAQSPALRPSSPWRSERAWTSQQRHENQVGDKDTVAEGRIFASLLRVFEAAEWDKVFVKMARVVVNYFTDMAFKVLFGSTGSKEAARALHKGAGLQVSPGRPKRDVEAEFLSQRQRVSQLPPECQRRVACRVGQHFGSIQNLRALAPMLRTVDRSLVEAALHGMSNQDCDAAYPDCHLP